MIFATISAYVYILSDVMSANNMTSRNMATNFILDQISKMPFFLRVGVNSLIILSSVFCFLIYKKFPHQLPTTERLDFVRRLQCSKFGPFRDLSQLLLNFTALGVYSEILESL